MTQDGTEGAAVNGEGQGDRMIPVTEERDIVTARNDGRTLCAEVGFGMTDQVKVATAISELARNIVLYAGSGEIELREITAEVRGIEIVARDQGPGIGNLDAVLAGAHRSQKGLGLGLLGTKRLMDYFDVQTGPDCGTTVTVRKFLR